MPFLYTKPLRFLTVFLTTVILYLYALPVHASDQSGWEVIMPPYTIRSTEARIKIGWQDSIPPPDTVQVSISYNSNYQTHMVIGGQAEIQFIPESRGTVEVALPGLTKSKDIRPIAPWVSILPPLLAICIALIFKEVFSALFIGLLLGTSTLAWSMGNNSLSSIWKGILMIADTYLPEALLDRGHISIILFSMLIGGVVTLVTRNGGMKGVVNLLTRYATTPRSTQFITWLLGIAIFFDDYANTLVVGNTMRPVTDKMRISREKLAYIVDSTAAPVASVAFITTWIGAELSYIQDGIRTLSLDESPYIVFLHSLQYAFYPLLTLVFMAMLIHRRVDYGPMLTAERRARNSGEPLDSGSQGMQHAMEELVVPDHIKPAWFNAVIPVLVIVLGAVMGLIVTGLEKVTWQSGQGFWHNLSQVIGQADSYRALLWASLAGVITAVLLTLAQRIFSLRTCMESLIHGFRTMLTAIVILILAWAMALITQHMHTADFLSRVVIDVQLSPMLVPAITFILAGLIAFSTGSSWGTMAILYPLILPASWLIGQESGLAYADNLSVFHNVVASVLAGAVLGDHCSPISDTTILSSLASSCPHVAHVRTQLPYALTVGSVAVLAGIIPAAYGISSALLYPLSILLLWLILRWIGKRVE